MLRETSFDGCRTWDILNGVREQNALSRLDSRERLQDTSCVLQDVKIAWPFEEVVKTTERNAEYIAAKAEILWVRRLTLEAAGQ